MTVRWHEFLIKDIDSVFQRIEEGFNIKEEIDNAILSPTNNLENIIKNVCIHLKKIIKSSNVEVLVVADNELIPMGIGDGQKFDYQMLLRINQEINTTNSSFIIIGNRTRRKSQRANYCFPIYAFQRIFMILSLERDEITRKIPREEEFIRLSQIVAQQLGLLIAKYTDTRRAKSQNELIALFFNNKLSVMACWREIVQQIGTFLPDWKPLSIEPPAKVQFLSYNEGDRYLRILATQGDELAGTEVLVDSSICGMLIEDPSKRYLLINPREHLDRYQAFLINSEKIIPQSELAIPIKYKGNIIGIINLEHSSDNIFKIQHIESLIAAAEFLAPFVDALKERHEIQRSKEIGILYTINNLLGRSSQLYDHLLGTPLLKSRWAIQDIKQNIQKNDPISSVSDNLDLISQSVEDIAKKSERFCQNLPAVMNYGPTPVNLTVERALSVFDRISYEKDYNIIFEVNIEENIQPVYASKLLQEHIHNIVNNSIYSLMEAREKEPGRQGKIQVSVRREEIKDKLDKATASTHVVFDIKDNGTGAPKEFEKKIGQPGATTKGIQGSGIGVSAAIDYVQSLGGQLKIINMPEKGFEVEFYLEKFDSSKHLSIDGTKTKANKTSEIKYDAGGIL